MLPSSILDDKTTNLPLYHDIIKLRPARFIEICKIAYEALNSNCVAIAIKEEGKSSLPVCHGKYSDEFSRQHSLLTDVQDDKTTIVVPNIDLTKDITKRKALKSCDICAYIAVPLILKAELVGTFFVAFNKPKKFENKDIFLMEGLGRIVISMLDISFLKLENAKQLSETKTLLDKINSQQTKLTRNDKILSHVSRLANIGGWEYDLTNQSIHWSDQVYEIHEVMLGTTIELASALNFYEPESRAMVAQKLRHTIETGDPFEFECCITTALGNIRNVRSIGEPEYENGHLIRIFGTFQDITEQRTIESQARQFLKMETLGQLTGEISHDFNNILSSVIGNLQFYLKRQQHLPGDSQEVSDALHSAQRGVKLTNRLLNFSRGKNFVIEPFDPSTIVHALESLMQEACGSNTRLMLEFESVGGSVATDISLFETSLLNLVINARDASPDHGEITVCVQNLGLNSSLQKGRRDSMPTEYISISVSDNGVGIPQSVIKRITEPFFTTKEPGKGTGLGLCVVHNLITRSGGQLNIDSVEGIGTTVTMLLPRLQSKPNHSEKSIQIH